MSETASSRRVVLVVAAHPDDEALGCGGTLARHTAAGDEVHLLFIAEGVTARDPICDMPARAPAIDSRKAMARQASKALGGYPPRFLNLPDNRLDGVELLNIVKSVEAVIAEVHPEVIYTNHANDLNIDHCIAHQAVLTACRPLQGSSVRAIYSFETLSSTEWEPAGKGRMFQPTRFVDISPHIDAKRAAIAAYDEEMRVFPHPRSPEAIEALWRVRGAQSGLQAAEAFVVIREIH